MDSRVRRLLEHGLTEDAWKALDAVATLPLLSDVSSGLQLEQLRSARTFLAAIKSDVETLRKLCDNVDQVVLHTGVAADAISASERETTQFLTQAEALAAHKAELEAAAERVSRVARAYSMDPHSRGVLLAGPSSPDFFTTFRSFTRRVDALEKADSLDAAIVAEQLAGQAKQLRAAALDATLQYCLTLLRDEASHDILLAGFGGVAGITVSDTSAALLNGVRLLAELAPSMARACQTAVVHARRGTLVRAMLDAAGSLAAGVGSAGPSAGERYLSDLLAWTRTRLLEEHELLAVLFPTPPPTKAEASVEAGSGGEEERLATVPELLSAISDGLARPLAARLEWATTSQDDLIPLFRIMDVLQFYVGSMTGLLPPDAPLCGAIRAGHANCRARVDTLAAIIAARIKAAVPAYPSGLGPAPAVLDAGALLTELCRATSSGGMGREIDGGAFEVVRQAAARACAEALVDAVLDSTAAAAGGLPDEDGAALQANACAALQSSLQSFALVTQVVQRLAGALAGHEESVVAAASSAVLTDSGLMRVLAAVRSGEGEGLAVDISTAATAFVRIVSAPAALRFDSITDPRVRQRVRRDTAGVLSSAYGTVYGAAGGGALPNSPGEIDVLLDLT
jgi:hypothetical protein